MSPSSALARPTESRELTWSRWFRRRKTSAHPWPKRTGYHVVAVKSTVLPGITEGVVKQTIEERSGRKLGDGWGLCMNPEFLREGRAVADFTSPDRIVIGASDDRAGETLLGVYAHLELSEGRDHPQDGGDDQVCRQFSICDDDLFLE